MSNKRLVVSYVQNGTSHEIEVEVPETSDSEDDQRREAAHYVQTLVDNGQLEGPGATHQILSKPNGVNTLRRRGFSSR